ncbi:MAG: GIY-YIG nuclease family protein [Sphingomonas sp.]
MTFWAYILRCADGSYYAEHTENLEMRVAAHQSGEIEGYTRSRRPVTLVWTQNFPSRIESLEAERRIKGWTRAKKEALIAGDWQRLSLLARNRQVVGRPSTGSGRADEGQVHLPAAVRAQPVEACSEGTNR